MYLQWFFVVANFEKNDVSFATQYILKIHALDSSVKTVNGLKVTGQKVTGHKVTILIFFDLEKPPGQKVTINVLGSKML